MESTTVNFTEKWIMGHKCKMSASLCLVSAATVLSACGSPEAESFVDAGLNTEFTRVINVEVSPIVTEPFIEEIRLTSVATANQDVMIEAEESGRVIELYADRGDEVRRGAAIVKIDDTILRTQVDQARAASNLATQTWERRKRLFEEDQVGSEIAYLEARTAAEQSSATLAGLE